MSCRRVKSSRTISKNCSVFSKQHALDLLAGRRQTETPHCALEVDSIHKVHIQSRGERDFPTPCPQCRKPGFDPWSGNQIPHATIKGSPGLKKNDNLKGSRAWRRPCNLSLKTGFSQGRTKTGLEDTCDDPRIKRCQKQRENTTSNDHGRMLDLTGSQGVDTEAA